MQSSFIGKRVRLGKPLMVASLDGPSGKGKLVNLADCSTLFITGEANETIGLLEAVCDGQNVLVFEQDLLDAMDTEAETQAAQQQQSV